MNFCNRKDSAVYLTQFGNNCRLIFVYDLQINESGNNSEVVFYPMVDFLQEDVFFLHRLLKVYLKLFLLSQIHVNTINSNYLFIVNNWNSIYQYRNFLAAFSKSCCFLGISNTFEGLAVDL